MKPAPPSESLATFGGGCFWCLDAVFRSLHGVLDVTCGYAGGSVVDPSYEAVCRGTTGHAEVVQVRFDPGRVTYGDLLEVFFAVHDPTTLNRQGADVGTQYRSIVLTHDDAQREAAEAKKRELHASGTPGVVTEIVPLGAFYPAAEYHQDYFAKNPGQGYCQVVIRPKVEKAAKAFSDRWTER